MARTKVRPRKKHGFLRFLLIVFLFFIVYKAAVFGCNKFAEHRLQGAVYGESISFAEGDYDFYVTKDFDLRSDFTYKDKVYPLTWTSSDDFITIDDYHASVSVDRDTSHTVTLTETYKFLLGRASNDYKINLIKSDTTSSYTTVKLDQVKSGEYERAMKIKLDENDRLKYMRGDFEEVTVGNVKEAELFTNTYKEQFGTDPEEKFYVTDIDSSGGIMTYHLIGTYKDYPIPDDIAILKVHERSFKPYKISIDADFSSSEVTLTDNETDIDTALQAYLGEGAEYQFEVGSKFISEDKFLQQIKVIYNDGEYVALIDLNNRSVEYFYNPTVSFGYDTNVSNSPDEQEKPHEDKHRENNQPTKVKVEDNSKNPKDGPGIKEIDITLNDNGNIIDEELQLTVRNNSMIVEDGKIKETDGYGQEYIIDNPSQFKIGDAVLAESYYYFRQAYDYYKDNLNWKSYDGKGASIEIHYLGTDPKDNRNVVEKILNCKPEITELGCTASWGNDIDYGKYFLGDPRSFADQDNKYVKSYSGHLNIYDYAVITKKETNLSKDIKSEYSFSANPEVLAHEYTHAVLHSKNMHIYDDPEGFELAAIDEGYADVMGCLISGLDEWKIGINWYDIDGDGKAEQRIYRDIENYNTHIENEKDTIKVLEGKEQAEKYKDENYERAYKLVDMHLASVLVSHVGWEMWKSEFEEPAYQAQFEQLSTYNDTLFDADDVARIWFESIDGYRFDSEFKDVPDHLCDAIDELQSNNNYSDKYEKYSNEDWIYSAQLFVDMAFMREGFTLKDNKYYETFDVKGANRVGDNQIRYFYMVGSPLAIVAIKAPVLCLIENDLDTKTQESIIQSLDNKASEYDMNVECIPLPKILLHMLAPEIDIGEVYSDSHLDTDPKSIPALIHDAFEITHVYRGTAYDFMQEWRYIK